MPTLMLMEENRAKMMTKILTRKEAKGKRADKIGLKNICDTIISKYI